MTEVEWVALAGLAAAVIAALGGAVVGHRLALSTQEKQAAQVRKLHLAALKAEIQYCAKLAHTYVKANKPGPLYRFPSTVHDTVYATLVSETLTDADVGALTSFYSQVAQMNRGLDLIDGYRATGNTAGINEEHGRLMTKARDMQHPNEGLPKVAPSEFYATALAAVERHLEK